MNRPSQCSYIRRQSKSFPMCEKSKCSAPQNPTRAIRMLYLRQVEYSEQRHQGYTDTRCPDAGISLSPVDIMMLARPNAVTEERSNARDSTRNSTYGILRPTSSSDVYRVGRYYVGVLKELPPPDIIYAEWNEHICGDLINHLLAVTDSLPNDIPDDHLIIEPVLCMAGKTKSMRLAAHGRHARGKVMLEPMVWIHCGSRKCRRKVKETIHQARFLRNFLRRFGMADAYIALEAPWPAASTSDQRYVLSDEQNASVYPQDPRPYGTGYDSLRLYNSPPWRILSPPSNPPPPPAMYPEISSLSHYSSTADISHTQPGNRMALTTWEYAENASSDSYMSPRKTMRDVDGRQLTLSFAVQRRYDIPSACGIRTRFSVHDSGSSLSTIGGLIVVDNSVFGLTTAHGIIGCLAASKTPSRSDTDEDTSDSSSDSEISMSVESSGRRIRRRGYRRGGRRPTQSSAQDEWSSLLVPNIVSYKGRGTLTGDYSLPTQSPPMSDFALIDLDTKLLGTLKNSYHVPSTSSIQDISGSLRNNQLSAGEVLIITSSNAIPGYLLEGTASIILRGTAMRTKKIQITNPHGWGLAQPF